MKVLSGQQIGPYKIKGILGTGGMGLVYEAVSINSGNVVALRVLKKTDTNFADKDAELRFNDEATASKKVKSQWTVKYIDSGVDSTAGHYIAYELLSGPSLVDFVKSNGTIPRGQVLKLIAKPLLLGLEDMHSQGIYHRDIKPDNMIQVDDKGIFKLCDLGIASFSNRAAKTKTGMIVGTPQYIAPERFSPDLATGSEAGTDIFSAAVLLTHLLTNEEPGSILHKNKKWSPSLTEVTKQDLMTMGLTPQVSQVLSKALSFDMSLRPSSCLKFFTELEEAISGIIEKTAATQLSSSKLIQKKVKSDSQKKHETVRKPSKYSTQTKKIFLTIIVICGIILLLWFVRSKSPANSQHQSIGRESVSKNSTLLKLAQSCDKALPPLSAFRQFIKEEDSLFTKTMGKTKQIQSKLKRCKGSFQVKVPQDNINGGHYH